MNNAPASIGGSDFLEHPENDSSAATHRISLFCQRDLHTKQENLQSLRWIAKSFRCVRIAKKCTVRYRFVKRTEHELGTSYTDESKDDQKLLLVGM